MNTRRGQRGMSGGLVAIVIVLILVGILAAQGLSRIAAGTRSSDEATVKLAALADAIEQYAASAGRLPCPANPALPTTDAAWGDEVVPSPNDGTCTFPEGTIPWRTIGGRGDDALDPWGWKVSYRVFTGTAGVAGSLTQPNGVNMVECDSDLEDQIGDGTATDVAGVSGGLCKPNTIPANTDPFLRSTFPTDFYAGKGFTVNDMGSTTPATPGAGAAFVLVSHGPTGQGAYTANGVRVTMPMGEELLNTTAGGPFHIKAFSAAGTEPGTTDFFDDRLFYRTLADLVRRTNLVARDWPEPPAPPPPPTATTSVRFDSATIAAARGSPVSPGSLGASTLTIGGATISGFGGSVETDLSYDAYGGHGGLAVMGASNALSSWGDEWLRIDLADRARWFAVTFVDFTQYDFFGTYSERVELKFFDDGVQVGAAVLKSACNDGSATSGLGSFSTLDPGGVFNRIEIKAISSIDASLNTWHSDFLLGEIKACAELDTPCTTGLADSGNTCL